MAPRFARLRLYGFPTRRPRARLRALRLAAAPCGALECLEDRTLLSASLALFNGNYSGTYSGSITVNNNGSFSKIAVNSTPLQATFNNGQITASISGGSGSGAINSHGNISGSLTTQIDGVNVPLQFVGQATAVTMSSTVVAGSWGFKVNLGNGVTLTGQGTWTASAPPVVSDFDGNYVGSYAGTEFVNSNGSITKSAVSPTAFQVVVSGGTISATFAPGSGLSNVNGTINAQGTVSGTVDYQIGQTTAVVNFSGKAVRTLNGITVNGVWSYTANLGNGVVESGQGTWSWKSILVFDGAYTGSFTGTVVVDNNGTDTTNPLPGSLVSNTSLQLSISNGVVTMTDPGVPAAGTGTIDANGNIAGTVTFQTDGVTVIVQFAGVATETPSGNQIMGTWTFSANLGNGQTESGQGAWTASNTPV